ncbi:NADPH:quinone oxidoreductase family protein [Kineosporia babensis]|uniref:NADPH:quinone oxidoreductase family protein n=1 Tax=Kineosporia babensis TaxID=499548 RepID=A0A9X1NA94_9ACTN|nr:NADPH:quinone oxidoreductase family protein [Kineosporia babensis]MCD5310184.1 NADPH:quinone oxidoreductase family protein [Kineosporia babensis]
MSTEAYAPSSGTVAAGSTMRAWRVTGPGDPLKVMRLEEVPVPSPGPGQVLVRVDAAGLGLTDAALAQGLSVQAPPPPFTPGLELCGEIVGVGPEVSQYRLGERVIGQTTLPSGALAQYAVARAQDVFPAPTALDDAPASVFHIAYLTAWLGLYRRASVHVGEWVLIYGAGGGLGSAAVQLALAAGAKVIAVVGSDEKFKMVRALGAQVVLHRHRQDVETAVRELTGGKGVQVVFDPVGGPMFEQSCRLAGFEARIVVAGFASQQAVPVAPEQVRSANFTVLGVNSALYREREPELVQRAHADLTRLLDAGALRPQLTETLAFDQAAQGVARLAEVSAYGRLAVAVRPAS